MIPSDNQKRHQENLLRSMAFGMIISSLPAAASNSDTAVLIQIVALHQASTWPQPLSIQRRSRDEALGRPRRDRRQHHQHQPRHGKAVSAIGLRAGRSRSPDPPAHPRASFADVAKLAKS